MERLLKAVENLLPFIHENGMEGETDYERAVIELEKAYGAAQQSVQQTASHVHEFITSDVCACGVTRKELVERRR